MSTTDLQAMHRDRRAAYPVLVDPQSTQRLSTRAPVAFLASDTSLASSSRLLLLLVPAVLTGVIALSVSLFYRVLAARRVHQDASKLGQTVPVAAAQSPQVS